MPLKFGNDTHMNFFFKKIPGCDIESDISKN